MAIFYSGSTRGFYDTSIHTGALPSDAKEITEERRDALLLGQSEGKEITADENGFPTLTDRPQPTASELDALMESRRAKAYRDESDPLFFKWQRGEATEQQWLDKIAEIKARWS